MRRSTRTSPTSSRISRRSARSRATTTGRVQNEVPVQDLETFISHARANPGKLNYGTIGRGSAQEVLALELAKAAGIRLTGIPYKGGADAMNDLVAGRVHLYVSPTLSILPQYKAGRLRVLAVTSPERLAAAPEIPTLAEKGFSFPALRLARPLRRSRHAAGRDRAPQSRGRDIVRSPDYRDMIEKAGSVPLSSTPDELTKILFETYEQTAAHQPANSACSSIEV